MYFLSLFFYWAFLSLENRHSSVFKCMTVTGVGGGSFYSTAERDNCPEVRVQSACPHLSEGGQVM